MKKVLFAVMFLFGINSFAQSYYVSPSIGIAKLGGTAGDFTSNEFTWALSAGYKIDPNMSVGLSYGSTDFKLDAPLSDSFKVSTILADFTYNFMGAADGVYAGVMAGQVHTEGGDNAFGLGLKAGWNFNIADKMMIAPELSYVNGFFPDEDLKLWAVKGVFTYTF